jgi:hypothetical protein
MRRRNLDDPKVRAVLASAAAFIAKLLNERALEKVGLSVAAVLLPLEVLTECDFLALVV